MIVENIGREMLVMRHPYVQDDTLLLSEYIDQLDNTACYRCWQETETQKGYNCRFTTAFENFANAGVQSRFIAAIIRKADGVCVGSVFLSAENTPPDLAIMIYPPYRNKGYATRAFSLAADHCFSTFELDCIYAGCYEDNPASLQMLSRCGFTPHPEGNQQEQHFLTGEDIVQLDFVKYRLGHRAGQ